MRFRALTTLFFLLLSTGTFAHASSSSDMVALDAGAMVQLESRADHAQVREQCFLYTQLIQAYTEVAGRQIAAGDMETASVTLRRIQHFAELIHNNLAHDAKKIKDAEMMMRTANFRLGQFLHGVSSEDKSLVASTISHLDKVHDELLAQVFTH